jgi:MtaA/CmuA family methyltransferase
MTAKERIYAIMAGQSFDRPAVTPIFMAWAAHFVGHSYREYYLNGDVLVKAQLAVTKAFNLDQISAISDPWREASAYGVKFDYPEEGVGKPKDILIQTAKDVSKLKKLDIEGCERLQQRVESVGKMASAVGRTHSVLGWVEGPLAEYADVRGLENALVDLIDAPELFLQAGEIIIQNAIDFALIQIQAGADMIGIGDAAASLIGPRLYEEFVLPLEQRLITEIHRVGGAVRLHICGDILSILKHVARTGADIIDVDWMVPLKKARELVGEDVTLCGNFDPSGVLLQKKPEDVARAAVQCLEDGGKKFFLMPGCEVPPATPEENIRAFCPSEGCLIREHLNL